MKNLAMPALLVAVLSGCASNTGVVPIGTGNYTIAKQQATGFPGLGNLRAEIIAEATAYCANRGAAFELLDVHETQPPYILGNYPRSEIQFTCVVGRAKPTERPVEQPREPKWDQSS